MINFWKKYFKNRLFKFWIKSLFLITLILLCVYIFIPRAKALDFMIDESGKFLQIDLNYFKMISLCGSPPIVPCFIDKQVGLSLVDFETKKNISKLKFDKYEIGRLVFIYPLDTKRIVCDLNDFEHNNIGVWNIKSNSFHLYKENGSGSFIGGSGISYDEHLIISHKNQFDRGAILVELTNNNKTNIIPEFQVNYPRFSPDGSRYAFFGEDHVVNETYLVVQLINNLETFKTLLRSETYFHDLSWSPTGKFIASFTYDDGHKLYIWKSNGDLVTIIPIVFNSAPVGHRFEWPWYGGSPVWLPKEDGVVVFDKNYDKNKYFYNIYEIKTILNENNGVHK